MAEAERILSQNEVDALLSAIDSGAQVPGPEEAAAAYDFRHPPRLAREQLRGLQGIHEAFARSLQAALSGLLRIPSDVRVAGLHALPLKEALQALPSPTVLALLSGEPFEGALVLEMNLGIAAPILERLLGSARAGSAAEARPLTALEWGVYDTLLARMLDLLRDAWAPAAAASFRVIRRESDPGALQLPFPEEIAVMAVLEIAAGDARGSLNLVFPARAVEGILPKLQAPPAGKPAAADTGLPQRISPAEVAVAVHLPGETIRLQEIRDLKPGDLIVSGRPGAAPVWVSVEGCPKFEARLGRLKDHRAVKVVGPAPPPAGAPRASVLPSPGPAPAGGVAAVEALLGVPLTASVVLAEKKASLKDVLGLRPGDLLEFPHRVEAPLELRVGDRRLADGAAVRVGERFGLRIASIAEPRDRVRVLGP